jgi:hypothetical protein
MDLQCGETGWFAVALLPMRAAAMPLQGAAHDSSSIKKDDQSEWNRNPKLKCRTIGQDEESGPLLGPLITSKER